MGFKKKNGYKVFRDVDGRQQYVHIRVMEKKMGGTIPSGLVVHHVNGRKSDNRRENLVAVTPGVHGRLHGKHPDACYRCGRRGHWTYDCYATKDYAGRWL
jgi:hypothetical protein